MTLHRFVDIKSMQTRHVKARQPHITHYHYLQFIVWVFHPFCQHSTLLLRCMMFGNIRSVRRCRSHNHFYHTFRQIVAMPLRTQRNDSVIKLHRNPATHRHDHCLTLKHLLTLLKVSDHIFGNIFYSGRTSYQCFQLSPTSLSLLHVIKLINA